MVSSKAGVAPTAQTEIILNKDETTSPAISIEALFLLCLIDAAKQQKVITCDIPGAFMQVDMDEQIHLKLDGEIAELLLRVDPSYSKYATHEKGKLVIYTEYRILQASLLFWKDLKKFLRLLRI